MFQKAFFLLILIALAVTMWFMSLQYEHDMLNSATNTLIALAVLYFIFRLVLDELVAKKVKDAKSKYSLRKIISTIYMVVLIITVITIWVPNPEALFIAYGLLAAGIAVALSDFFKNLAGGVILFLTRPYAVGDRIEVKSEFGDVIDIGIMYTTLMEMREWIDGDQATGRLTLVPNGFILANVVNNYTKDNEFIWDEIRIPITYDSDWRRASKDIMGIVKKETAGIIKTSSKEYAHLRTKYYLSDRPTEPNLYIKVTDNWIDVAVRYMTPARQRRALNAKISRLVLEKIEKSKNVKVASATYDIVGFPAVKIRK